MGLINLIIIRILIKQSVVVVIGQSLGSWTKTFCTSPRHFSRIMMHMMNVGTERIMSSFHRTEEPPTTTTTNWSQWMMTEISFQFRFNSTTTVTGNQEEWTSVCSPSDCRPFSGVFQCDSNMDRFHHIPSPERMSWNFSGWGMYINTTKGWAGDERGRGGVGVGDELDFVNWMNSDTN